MEDDRACLRIAMSTLHPRARHPECGSLQREVLDARAMWIPLPRRLLELSAAAQRGPRGGQTEIEISPMQPRTGNSCRMILTSGRHAGLQRSGPLLERAREHRRGKSTDPCGASVPAFSCCIVVALHRQSGSGTAATCCGRSSSPLFVLHGGWRSARRPRAHYRWAPPVFAT